MDTVQGTQDKKLHT